MKNLLLTGVLPPMSGGSGRWFWELYRRLPRENSLIVAADSPEAREFDAAHDVDVRRVPYAFDDYGALSIAGYSRYRRLVQFVRRLAVDEQVGAIHCGALLPDGWIGRQAARALSIPLLVYLHGEERCYADASRQLNWMAKRVCDSAAAVIVNSENTKQIAEVHWQVPRRKAHLLHPGVDCSRFVPADVNPRLRRSLGWGDRPTILTVSRLQARKGQDQLIRALPMIRESVPNVHCAIVGDGERRAHLESLVASLDLVDHVTFHGEMADQRLTECYQQCDLFVLPNRRIGNDIEGFGMVLLEAQACGKPVVAGNTGGTRETMHEGVTGFIVDVEDANALAAPLIAMLTRPQLRRTMGEAARSWAVARFDWPALAAAAADVFCGISLETSKHSFA